MLKRILTGDRPTGPLHLGHYAGSLSERLKYQADPESECFFIIADYQVMTDRLNTKAIQGDILEVVRDYLAVGINPDKSVIFVQSQIPELAELTMFFSMLTSMSALGRNPTVKEEVRAAGLGAKMSLGMFSYPVSQAADILLFDATHVPVGEDQLPHLEMTKQIGRRFNAQFGETLVIPEPVVSNVPRLLGLDGNQKMSKSRGNTINLSDNPDVVRKKIRGAVTDSGIEVYFDSKEKPAISNLLLMYQIATGDDMSEIEKYFSGKRYGFLKEQLVDALNAFLAPIRERRERLSDHAICWALQEGTFRAEEEASVVMRRIREALHFDYPKIFS